MAVNGPPRPLEVRLGDPLSKLTRTERRNLIAASSIGIFIVKTGFLPTKIENLGIEFTVADRAVLLQGLTVLVVYFLVAFVVYGWHDFLRWRWQVHRAHRDLAEAQERDRQERGRRYQGDPAIPENAPPGVVGAFAIYGQKQGVEAKIKAEEKRLEEIQRVYLRQARWLISVTPLTIVTRGIVEFAIPIAIAGFALYILVQAWWVG